MFRTNFLFLTCLAALLGSPAHANSSDNDAMRKTGLIGNWAMDCSSPYGPTNAWMSYAIHGSGPVRILNYRKGLDGTFDLSGFKLIDQNHVSFFDRNSEGTVFETVYEKTSNRLQSISSKRGDGVFLIKDGKFVSSGQPTPVFQKCTKK
jgi:hypothetical protein